MRKLLICAAFLAAPVVAEEPVGTLDQRRLDRIASNPERFATTTLREMFAIAPQDGVVDQAGVERWATRDRGMRLQRYLGLALAYDHDGDFYVTQDEINAVDTLLSGGQREAIERFFAAHDADGDNILSPSEIRRGAESELDIADGGADRAPRHLLAFDMDGDGRATPMELLAYVETRAGRPLAEVRGPRGQTFGGAAEACDLPALSARAEPVYIQAHEGAALSTVSVAGRDAATTVARLEIEPGETPLYLYLNARTHVLWSLTGATQRVEHVVLGLQEQGAGIAGLPNAKVTLWQHASCDRGAAARRSASGQTLQSLLGSKTQVTTYTLGHMKIPSGVDVLAAQAQQGLEIEINGRRYRWGQDGMTPIEDFANDAHGETRQTLYRFHPLGIDSVAPEDVVARGRVAAYDVLPQEAGLLQLLDAGALTRNDDGHYVIEEPIARFPPGLTGAHRVQFVLVPGVPMPAGSPGHSSVISAETGACLVGACR